MRKTKSKKRLLMPDPRYKDILVTRFVNNMMIQGKKSIAFHLFYEALDMIDERTKKQGEPALDVWKKALDNVTPMVEVKSRRVGGATFQVPIEVRSERKVAISMRNLIKYARQRSGRSMSEKLASEIMAAYNEEGGAFKKKEEMHRMAEANKAFAHFKF